MAMSMDLVVLWSTADNVRCVMAHAPDGWEVRLERDGQVMRVAKETSPESAFETGERWRRRERRHGE
jgi:hypothetical protein